MKLVDLLNVIPDSREVCLLRPKDTGITIKGTKDEAVAKFASESKLIKEQVKNFDVVRVYTCAYLQCGAAYILDEDYIPLNISIPIVIEID